MSRTVRGEGRTGGLAGFMPMMGTVALRPLRTFALLALVAALVASWLPGTAARAMDSAADHVAVETRVTERTGDGVVPGSEFNLMVTFTIEEGWHFYGPGDFYDQQTVFLLDTGIEGLDMGEFRPLSKPKAHKYEWDEGPRMEFGGTVTYEAVVRVLEGAKPGDRTVSGTAEVNLCNDAGCLPPEKLPFEVVLPVRAAAAPAAADPVPPVEPEPAVTPPAAPPKTVVAATPPEEEKGITSAFLLLAFTAGLLTILTPCVFPMLPLTVSLLTKRAQKEPDRVVRNAFIYGVGMFASLAGIGLLLSVGFGVAPTEFALDPWFNLAIFAFLMALAFSLFGAFDIQLPAFMSNWAQSKAGGGGSAGLFFMGMTLAFTSFSCAAPFAGTLLLAARSDLTLGVVGMSVYAATFTAPFFVLALFPGLLQKLPRSGGWLNSVKVVMGFVEVAAAFKFLRVADINWGWGVFSYNFVLAIWVACALGCALYLLGFIVLPHDTKADSIGVPRLMVALLFLAGGLYLLPGIFERPLPPFIEAFILPDAKTGAEPGRGTESAEGPDWGRFEDDLDGAMIESAATGRPVFLDFTGDG